MPAIMMSADVGSIPKVTGMSNAMLADGPMPGSTPTIVPRNTPRNVYQRLTGCRQTRKPFRMCVSVSMSASEREYALREAHTEHFEHPVAAEAEEDGRERVGGPFAGVEIRCQRKKIDRRREDVAQAFEHQ